VIKTMNPYWQSNDGRAVIYCGDSRDVLRGLPDKSVQACITSPPYFGLRDYNVDGQIGMEETPEEYVAALVAVFRNVRRVLRDDGTVWLNLADSYAGSGRGAKNLIGIPWRVAFALQVDGWYLRQDIIWAKPNPMPESVRDRCTKSHEYIFLLSQAARYYFDSGAIAEPLAKASIARLAQNVSTQKGSARVPGKTNGAMKAVGGLNGKRNRRSVWTVPTTGFKDAHFATYPPELIEPCVLAGAPEDGVVLDPFHGSGTTGMVALRHGRRYIGIELNESYLADFGVRRVADVAEALPRSCAWTSRPGQRTSLKGNT
jgi:DNA modification methylase